MSSPRWPEKSLEDVLAHLPCSRIVYCPKGQTIYGPGQPPTGVYLVIDGKVKVARVSAVGAQFVVGIYQPDELFGESSLLNPAGYPGKAIALESTKLMFWTSSEIQEMLATRPKLALAILQILAQRSVDYSRRISDFSEHVARRLALSLIYLSERLGTPEENGSVRMIALTHQFLAQYVGTSREIITHYMNQFRRRGYLRYSRQGIILHIIPFREWLRQVETK